MGIGQFRQSSDTRRDCAPFCSPTPTYVYVTQMRRRFGRPTLPLSVHKGIPISPHRSKRIALLAQLTEISENCVTFICTKGYNEGGGTSFHSFPLISEKRKGIKLYYAEPKLACVPHTNGRVCCRHFEGGIFPFFYISFCKSTSDNFPKKCESRRSWVKRGFQRVRDTSFTRLSPRNAFYLF